MLDVPACWDMSVAMNSVSLIWLEFFAFHQAECEEGKLKSAERSPTQMGMSQLCFC